MIAIYLLFLALLVTMAFWLYYEFQYFRKRNDRLVSYTVMDRYEAKKQTFLIASLGLLFPLLLLLFFL